MVVYWLVNKYRWNPKKTCNNEAEEGAKQPSTRYKVSKFYFDVFLGKDCDENRVSGD